MPGRTSTRAEIARHISDVAAAFGWRHHHSRCTGVTRDGYADGFPPDVLLRDGRLVFVAVCGRNGLLTAPQADWAAELDAVSTVEVLMVRRDGLRALARALEPRSQTKAAPRADTRAPPGTVAA